MTKLDEALGLFPSCIKSGEDWSPRCQEVWDGAKNELTRLRTALKMIAEDDPSGKYGRWAREGLAHADDRDN